MLFYFGCSKGSQAWPRIDTINKLIRSSERPPGVSFIKIAVLDTGLDLHSRYVGESLDEGQRVEKNWKDFAGSKLKPANEDNNRHGTMVTALLLRAAKYADTYVVHIAKSGSELDNAAENVEAVCTAQLHLAVLY